jgi:hypothetical protein
MERLAPQAAPTLSVTAQQLYRAGIAADQQSSTALPMTALDTPWGM